MAQNSLPTAYPLVISALLAYNDPKLCVPILPLEPTNWLPLVRNFGRLFHRIAGAPRTLDRHGRWKRFRPGRAELLGTG